MRNASVSINIISGTLNVAHQGVRRAGWARELQHQLRDRVPGRDELVHKHAPLCRVPLRCPVPVRVRIGRIQRDELEWDDLQQTVVMSISNLQPFPISLVRRRTHVLEDEVPRSRRIQRLDPVHRTRNHVHDRHARSPMSRQQCIHAQHHSSRSAVCKSSPPT